MKRYLTDIGKLVGKDNVMFFLVLLNLTDDTYSHGVGSGVASIMRRYLTTLLAAAALWAWPVTLCVTSYPLLVGCKSTKTTAYKTLAATETTVDASLKAFANARVHGKVDDPTFSKVQKLYSQYQVAFSAAVRTAQLDPNALTPADVASLAANLTATIEAILH